MNTTMAWGTLIRLINFAYSAGYTTNYTIENNGGSYSSGHWMLFDKCIHLVQKIRKDSCTWATILTLHFLICTSCMVKAKWVLVIQQINDKCFSWQFNCNWIKDRFIYHRPDSIIKLSKCDPFHKSTLMIKLAPVINSS